MPKCPREEKLFGDIKTSFIKRNHFADDDDVIAGVLAHEAGHVIKQHSMLRWGEARS